MRDNITKNPSDFFKVDPSVISEFVKKDENIKFVKETLPNGVVLEYKILPITQENKEKGTLDVEFTLKKMI